ncbi:MAG: hypothetical protein WD602_06055, partial [Actinomycetota bacterium]
MPMEWFCFRVSEEVARGLFSQSPTGAAASIRRALETSDLKIEPLRPGAQHPAFRRWFKVRVGRGVDGQALLQRLLDAGSIECGYLKADRSADALLLKGWTV